MRLFRTLLLTGLVFVSTLSLPASRIRRGPTSSKHKASKVTASPRPRVMDDERASQIQAALVKAGYLDEATGHWDSASQTAMQKLQADNGWQTKIVPDSRALIKLGLGPDTRSSATKSEAPLAVLGSGEGSK